jgi:hypothetical protein
MMGRRKVLTRKAHPAHSYGQIVDVILDLFEDAAFEVGPRRRNPRVC